MADSEFGAECRAPLAGEVGSLKLGAAVKPEVDIELLLSHQNQSLVFNCLV